MVRYTRLWDTMKEKGISQYRLITYYKVSAGQIGRLKKNMHVSTHTLEMLCTILQCPVEDIMEIIVDASAEEPAKKAPVDKKSPAKKPPAKKTAVKKKNGTAKTEKKTGPAE